MGTPQPGAVCDRILVVYIIQLCPSIVFAGRPYQKQTSSQRSAGPDICRSLQLNS